MWTPPPSFPQSHTAKLAPTPHRILTPRNPKKKKNKNQKEKTRKRKEGRLTTSPQGAHCPEQPPPFTLTPTHPLFLLLPLSKFFDQNSRERKVKIK